MEVFGCGTAAIVSPVGGLKWVQKYYVHVCHYQFQISRQKILANHMATLYIVIIIIYMFINRQMAHKLIVGNFFVGIFCTFCSTNGDFEIYLATLTQNDGESLKNGDVGMPAMETTR